MHLGIRTVPVRYGRKGASLVSFVIVCATAVLGLVFPLVVPMPLGWAYAAATVLVSAYFLLVPAIRWLRDQTTASAMAFFNLACFYPLAVFVVLTISILVGRELV